MTNPQSIRQRAQAGSPTAIAALLNHSLKSDGIKAKVARQGDRLKIALLCKTPPNPNLGQRITVGLKQLQIANISQCQISAYQPNQSQPIWSKTLALSQSPTSSDSVAIQPPQVHPEVPMPHLSPQNSTSSAGDRPAKVGNHEFWQRGITFLFSVPLIVHGSLRFLLTLETQLFGIENPVATNPNKNIIEYFFAQLFGNSNRIPFSTTTGHTWLYLLTLYGGSLAALILGFVLLKYALQKNKPLAKPLFACFAIIPTLFVIACIVSEPILLLPTRDTSSSVWFIHPVTNVWITRTFQVALVVANILLFITLGLTYFRAVIRPYQGISHSFWQILRHSWKNLWGDRRNEMINTK